jgi:DNA (cytosine-5)-methyltransferase 1
MLVLSLFPGIGLLDHAFELEGFCIVRGPDVLWGGDVRRFRPPAGKFDGIIGGPPCQAFSSLAHLVRANGHEPRFGNLIPEYERCVSEARPSWFLMENVPAAPVPAPPGYGVKSFLLDNSALDGGDGFGLEQRRVRRFSFGLRGREAPNLLRWIDLATFLLPDAQPVLTQGTGFPHDEAFKEREAQGRARRAPPLTAGHDSIENTNAWSKRKKAAIRAGTVTGSDGGASVRMGRYKLADALRLQGLPEDFLTDAPFTAEGKLKAVANGVPIPMGRAIARAVLEATRE